MAARGKENNKYGGMNWIRPVKRLALYLRDGMACCYCGATVEDGARLTLDHLTPHVQGGGNGAENLVTCCHKCNSSRGARDWRGFAEAVAGYLNHGVTGEMIIAHITETISRPVPLTEAKELMARRGGFTGAVKNNS